MSYDVVIIGAGLAGLQLARLLSRAGAAVLLSDRRASVSEGIRTTGIFVRRTFDDFSSLHPFLGPSIRSLAVHSPAGRSIELRSSNDEFRVGRMKPLYEAMLQQAVAAGAEWRPQTTYTGLSIGADCTWVHFRSGERIKTRFLVGADGARSSVARGLGLDENRSWIAGVEDVYASASTGDPRFDCWIDASIAPGYLAWMVDDGQEMHVGVGGFPKRFDPRAALETFTARLRSEGRLSSPIHIERRGGLIPVNGVLRRIGCARGLLVGDAAGAVSPLTAGGLDACMRLSEHAGHVLLKAIESPGAMREYQGSAFRTRFASRLAMRWLYNLGTRSNALVELGFAIGRTSLASPFINHVFFGRGSFPDPVGAVSASSTHPSSSGNR
jgi:flavin-dependent dehydrogenase